MSTTPVHSLVPSFLRPEIASRSYVPGGDVMAYSPVRNSLIMFEVFAFGGSFGFRCQAWVASRDAGGNVRDHLWQELALKYSVIAGSISEAKELVVAFAASQGFSLNEWVNAQPPYE